MARNPVRLLILSLLFASPALAQSSWLHPSDREYQYAIDSAYGETSAGQDTFDALEFLRALPSGTDSYISVRPPLACANVTAQGRKEDYQLAPTISEIKQLCDGKLLVAVRYQSAPGNLQRSLAVEHGKSEIKPSQTFFDHARSDASTDDGGAPESKPASYEYLDVYFITPDAAWNDEVDFVAPDVDGQQAKLAFDFASQVQNERRIAAAAR